MSRLSSPPLIDWQQPVNRSHSLNRGLVAWWMAVPGRVGWKTAKWWDLCGKHHGTLTNMDPATDWVAGGTRGGWGGLDFDGSNDKVSAGTISEVGASGNLTASVLVRHTGGNSLADAIASRALGASGSHAGFVIGANGNSGSWQWMIDDGSGDAVVRSATRTSLFSNNSWTMATLVWDGSLSCYLDGEDITSSLSLFTVGTVTGAIGGSTVTIGNRPGTTARAMSGQLDDAKVYSRALAPAEVAELYRQSQSYYPDLLRRRSSRRYYVMPAASGGFKPWFVCQRSRTIGCGVQ
ncbi:hypothetical protein Pla52o_35200 [Novipirellula galeiformis]|uniref:LamG-like jellyroll fold domain-containing protein n=1 Tax=Novipirellula galeiformis TaxID=2528004 RepID=A0A5C6CFZ3_9BACT|nr:LamG-like jellyroll fold domain-containing protein [Novipirellula galeiformis]TWU22464.1 hypothetical protein Pla52o_35200 [Novipirellula galeiformis]